MPGHHEKVSPRSPHLFHHGTLSNTVLQARHTQYPDQGSSSSTRASPKPSYLVAHGTSIRNSPHHHTARSSRKTRQASLFKGTCLSPVRMSSNNSNSSSITPRSSSSSHVVKGRAPLLRTSSEQLISITPLTSSPRSRLVLPRRRSPRSLPRRESCACHELASATYAKHEHRRPLGVSNALFMDDDASLSQLRSLPDRRVPSQRLSTARLATRHSAWTSATTTTTATAPTTDTASAAGALPLTYEPGIVVRGAVTETLLESPVATPQPREYHSGVSISAPTAHGAIDSSDLPTLHKSGRVMPAPAPAPAKHAEPEEKASTTCIVNASSLMRRLRPSTSRRPRQRGRQSEYWYVRQTSASDLLMESCMCGMHGANHDGSLADVGAGGGAGGGAGAGAGVSSGNSTSGSTSMQAASTCARAQAAAASSEGLLLRAEPVVWDSLTTLQQGLEHELDVCIPRKKKHGAAGVGAGAGAPKGSEHVLRPLAVCQMRVTSKGHPRGCPALVLNRAARHCMLSLWPNMDAGSMQDLMAHQQWLSERATAAVARQLLESFEYVHQRYPGDNAFLRPTHVLLSTCGKVARLSPDFVSFHEKSKLTRCMGPDTFTQLMMAYYFPMSAGYAGDRRHQQAWSVGLLVMQMLAHQLRLSARVCPAKLARDHGVSEAATSFITTCTACEGSDLVASAGELIEHPWMVEEQAITSVQVAQSVLRQELATHLPELMPHSRTRWWVRRGALLTLKHLYDAGRAVPRSDDEGEVDMEAQKLALALFTGPNFVLRLVMPFL